MRWDAKSAGYPLGHTGFEETKSVSRHDFSMQGGLGLDLTGPLYIYIYIYIYIYGRGSLPVLTLILPS
jgi:hypothetical protein